MFSQIKEIPKYLPKEESYNTLKIWLIFSIIAIVISFFCPIFFLTENQILYIFSSATQVIAAIYGLLITGYIFLRNELDRQSDKDESLEEVNQILKNDYYSSIVSISLITLISLFLCFLILTIENLDNFFVILIIINLAYIGILIVLVKIILFVIKILNPDSLEIASNKLRESVTKDESDHKGSLEEFLKNYNQIEYILDKYGDAFSENPSWDYEVIKKRRIPKTKLVQILYREEKINESLKNNLINLISFRNSLIHGSELYLSKQDVKESEIILNELKNILLIR